MTKRIETRIYGMSDADLKQLGDMTGIKVTRDILDFETRGVTALTVTELEALVLDFFNTPTDDEFLGPIIDATNTKNALAEQLRIALRSIRSMADLKYKGTGKYYSFGFKDMARLSDNDLVILSEKVVRAGTLLLTELASEGLTEAQLTALTNLNTTFDNALDAQDTLILTRDLATQNRVSKGNILYAEIVRLCTIGQSLYIDTDPAKYNDYVIYGSSSTPASLRGLVRDSVTQEPLVGAIIDIPSMGLTKISNSEGKFEVQLMEAGSYDMVVSHPGYQTQPLPVIIVEGETTHVTIDLVHD